MIASVINLCIRRWGMLGSLFELAILSCVILRSCPSQWQHQYYMYNTQKLRWDVKIAYGRWLGLGNAPPVLHLSYSHSVTKNPPPSIRTSSDTSTKSSALILKLVSSVVAVLYLVSNSLNSQWILLTGRTHSPTRHCGLRGDVLAAVASLSCPARVPIRKPTLCCRYWAPKRSRSQSTPMRHPFGTYQVFDSARW